MNGAVDAILGILHAVSSIVGFGAVAVTGVEAFGARGETPSPAAQRYFRPGINWASMSLLLTPFLGAGIEVADNYPDVHLLWPWLALGIWLVAAALAIAVHWPAEREIQRLLTAGDPDRDRRRRACLRAASSSAVMTLAFLAALAVMLIQPR